MATYYSTVWFTTIYLTVHYSWVFPSNHVLQIKLQKKIILDLYHFVHVQEQEYVPKNEIIGAKFMHILIFIALSKLFSIWVVPNYILTSKK